MTVNFNLMKFTTAYIASPVNMEELKSNFWQTKVVITLEEAKQIEQQTCDQADSERWILNKPR